MWRLNPGRLAEVQALTEFDNGMAQVREIITRETMGAVSPRTQVLAVDAIMQQHHKAIADVVSAAVSRHDRVLAPDDAFRVVLSLVEHVTMVSYWLELARHFRNIPIEVAPRQLSVAKSRARRMGALKKIKGSCHIAFALMDQLLEIAPSPEVKRLLDRINLELVCVQIIATLAAWTGGAPLPRNAIDAMVSELNSIRFAPDFATRPPYDRNLLWHSLSRLYEAIGDEQSVRRALAERRGFTKDDPDARARLLVEMLAFAQGDDERLALVHDLIALARSTSMGQLFSRERVGRLSITRDAFASAAVSADANSPWAAALIDDAIDCYRWWLFGAEGTRDNRTVALVSDWSGRGRGKWQKDGNVKILPFLLDVEQVAKLYVATDRLRPTNHGRFRDALAFIDSQIAPMLAEALPDIGETRIETLGPIGMLPLLATMVHGEPIGANARISFSHPNPNVTANSAEPLPFDLLVVDESIGSEAARVQTAFRRTAPESARVVTFNSTNQSTALSSEVLADVLQSASCAAVFCHVQSNATNASESGVDIGPESKLTVKQIAILNLRCMSQLAIIGCGSGRSNPFVGDVSVAHAAAMAGAVEVVYSLWPISSTEGEHFASGLLRARQEGKTAREYLAEQFREDRVRSAPFAVMEP